MAYHINGITIQDPDEVDADLEVKLAHDVALVLEEIKNVVHSLQYDGDEIALRTTSTISSKRLIDVLNSALSNTRYCVRISPSPVRGDALLLVRLPAIQSQLNRDGKKQALLSMFLACVFVFIVIGAYAGWIV